jgi:hypothetical protein
MLISICLTYLLHNSVKRDLPLCGTKAMQEMVNIVQKELLFSFVLTNVGRSHSTQEHCNKSTRNRYWKWPNAVLIAIAAIIEILVVESLKCETYIYWSDDCPLCGTKARQDIINMLQKGYFSVFCWD